MYLVSVLVSIFLFPWLNTYLHNLFLIAGSELLSFSQSAVVAVLDPPGFCEFSYLCMQVFPLIATWNLSSFE